MKRILGASLAMVMLFGPAANAAAPDEVALVLPTPAPAAAPDFNARLLAAHNRERLAQGVAPLRWSDDLAADAAIWARHLAATASFDHAPDQKDRKPQGENLWMGTRASYAAEDMVGLWVDEKAIFRRGKFPAISTTADWRDAAHYTQLIWSSTTKVGCALAANQQDEYLVCRYDPAGNWMDEDPLAARPRE